MDEGNSKDPVRSEKHTVISKRSRCPLNSISYPIIPHSLLEVGALKPDNYRSCSSWIEWMPIDLNSRHPRIIQQDFLSMDLQEHQSSWDAISLSLVVNFVPEPTDRGTV